ncbi:succinyl-diaminopimelate desuccinylase [Agromyces seonyuensis]|uniref:Succinyl-diaminopimelate desuccinylase n=1 Tax=Agromyces seonyuensis TaxID=2662446 RepID=A0A6I4NZ14_9MICO|nr:succinyl-diaminopimelate desuccinylase [Agromyces seonyuensis]MWB99546.1 succinyl-diaminopimelate desuccinylase [Agromyces seonyuensis]
MSLDLTATSIDLTRQLVDIPSVSGDEGPIADLVEAALAGATHLEVIRDGDAIVARTDLGRARRVVIAGHLDTVPINGNVPSHVETDEAGETVLWGRGTTDMKAGVAVQLKLAVELAEPAVDLTWIWYDHEEVAASLNGLGRIARNRPDLLAGDFAILGEPSNGRIEGGCNGTVRVRVTARGVRSHSARAWMGVNAVHGLAPALAKLAAYEPAIVPVDGLDYRESLNAVEIGGGVATNVIPDKAWMLVNYRFAPDKSAAEAIAFLEEFFAGYEVVVDDAADGARPGLDAPLAQEFVRAVGVEAGPKYGWTDVARFAALGVPAVNYGPGDPSLAHKDDERVPVAQITDCEEALRAWLTGAITA